MQRFLPCQALLAASLIAGCLPAFASDPPSRRSDGYTTDSGERVDGRRERSASRKGKEAMTSDEAIEQLSLRIAERLAAMKAERAAAAKDGDRQASDKRTAAQQRPERRPEPNRLTVQNPSRTVATSAATEPAASRGPANPPIYQKTTYPAPAAEAMRPGNGQAAALAAAHRRAHEAAAGPAAGAPAVVAAPPISRITSLAHAPARNAADTAAAAHPHAAATGHVHWSYAGESGPEHWARLHPEFARCSTGARQSPIDIREGFRVDLEAIRFDYQPAAFRVIDNGHTVQVNLAAGSGLTVGGRRYELVQFHFHRPSEERVDGKQYDMVAHLVHKDAEGRLAVVAVLLERGATPQPGIQTGWANLPLEQG
ncbi:MAG TPA: carbonic anhydrase family protein, partial [Burkholderiaceae bacterium]|nr:carbonic anhydrase family protein [Burkholderiaceae bacterium]